MNWLRVIRVLRVLVWDAAFIFGLYRAYELNRSVVRFQPSAMQETALIGFVLVDLVCAYLVVKAFDVALELRERGLLENAAKGRPYLDDGNRVT